MSLYKPFLAAWSARRARVRRLPYASGRNPLPNVGASVNPFALIWS